MTNSTKALHTKWFEDVRFGMFIHFGLYSIPAGVWNGMRMGRNDYAEWIRYQLYWPETHPIPRSEYDTLLAQFNPVGFDANAWVAEAKGAGMRYMVVTTKHHDGFALWDSKVSAYSAVSATPFNRDLISELTTACRHQGLKVGFYYSHWQDWEFPGGGLPEWESQQPDSKAIDHYWNAKCLPQVRELLEKFSPDLFWFDSWGPGCREYLTDERLDRLIETVKNIKPECLINSRIGRTEGVDFVSNDDNSFPDKDLGVPWETSGTFNESWAYHRLDTAWKSSEKLLRHLIDNASRGGNYQLNIGPTGEGVFPSEASDRLKEVGAWMRVNGEAIYGSIPAPYPEPHWGRLTQRDDPEGRTVYLYAFIYPGQTGKTLKILGLKTLPAKARFLGIDAAVEIRNKTDGVEFDLPGEVCPGSVLVAVFWFDPAFSKRQPTCH